MNRLNTLSPSSAEPASSRGLHFDEVSGHAGYSGIRPPINVGHTERGVSIAAGTALLATGVARAIIQRRPLSGLLVAGAGACLVRRGVRGHCRVYSALGVDSAKDERPDPHAFFDHGVKIEQAVVVMRPAQELFDFWRDLRNLAGLMPAVREVRDLGNGRTHWVARGPGGIQWEYEAEIINDEPPHLLAWRTVGGADIQHAGSVRFIEISPGESLGPEGPSWPPRTQVRVNIEYLPPAGRMGKSGAKLLRLFDRSPENDVRASLWRFKKAMEGAPATAGRGC